MSGIRLRPFQNRLQPATPAAAFDALRLHSSLLAVHRRQRIPVRGTRCQGPVKRCQGFVRLRARIRRTSRNPAVQLDERSPRGFRHDRQREVGAHQNGVSGRLQVRASARRRMCLLRSRCGRRRASDPRSSYRSSWLVGHTCYRRGNCRCSAVFWSERDVTVLAPRQEGHLVHNGNVSA